MRFELLSGIACLIAAVVAQTGTKPNPPTVSSDYSVTAGQSSTFTWKPTTQGPVTLTLRSGAASDLNKGTVIAQGIQNSGSYTFTLPPDTTRNSDYTIEISVDGSKDPDSSNYSAPFVVESKNTVASITPSASASATASMTSAASAMSSAASSASSAASSADSMSSSAQSASSTGSAQSASSSARVASGSSSATAANSATSTSGSSPSSSSSGSSSASTPAAAAPSTGAGATIVSTVHAGFVAILFSIVAIF